MQNALWVIWCPSIFHSVAQSQNAHVSSLSLSFLLLRLDDNELETSDVLFDLARRQADIHDQVYHSLKNMRWYNPLYSRKWTRIFMPVSTFFLQLGMIAREFCFIQVIALRKKEYLQGHIGILNYVFLAACLIISFSVLSCTYVISKNELSNRFLSVSHLHC